jgi:hypothetical protein
MAIPTTKSGSTTGKARLMDFIIFFSDGQLGYKTAGSG